MIRQLLILVYLFFSISLVGQSKYLSGVAPSLEASGSGKYFIITVSDSADALTDTLKVEVYSSATLSYSLIGVQDLYSGDYATQLIPGDGVSRRYLVNEPYPTRVKVTRTNISNITRRTFVWIISKGQ